MQIVNLTPHSIRIGHRNIRQTGRPIRVEQREQLVYTVDSIPVKMLMTANPDLSILPEPKSEVIYIVSRLVADVYKNYRDDFVFPYEFTRTSSGEIQGCKSLARFEPNA